MIRRRTPVRRGVAAAEVALITAVFMVPMVIGIWEIGRLIQVQQIVSNSAREGARLAAQGYTLNNAGVPTQVTVSSGAYNVNDFVYQYLYGAGLTTLAKSDVTVTFCCVHVVRTSPGCNMNESNGAGSEVVTSAGSAAPTKRRMSGSR